MSTSRYALHSGLLAAGLLLGSSLLTVVSCAAPIMNSQNTVKIVENDQAQSVIVTPDKPSAVVSYAATELQAHIKKATGVSLDIVAEADLKATDSRARIYLGPTAATSKAGLTTDGLAPNAFRRETQDNAVFLIGKDDGVVPPLADTGSMGTLLAVYDWLETQMGVKWLWPGDGGTVVPATKNIAVKASGEKMVEPRLIQSSFRPSAWPGGMSDEVRKQYVYDINVWLRRQRFVRGVNMAYGHAYTQYWERFGATHPDYFALRPDGIRAPFDPKRPQLVQMDVSNPALHQQIVADWLVQRVQKPSLKWINGIENDKTANDPACTCEVCRSWDPKNNVDTAGNPWLAGQEDGQAVGGTRKSLSDRYAKFWLALQAEGRKHDPDATVIGYAYADYSLPPVETKLNKNIIVGIVPHGSFPQSPEDQKAFRAQWEGWAKTGARLYLRPNYTLLGYDMPYVYAHQLGEEFKFSAENGMVATDFDSLLGMWGVQGVNSYMLARLNVDPTQKVDDILNEYYAGFGPASGEVKAYFNYWEQVTLGADTAFRARSKGGWASISKSGDEIYTPETFVKGEALLAAAKKSAQGDADATQKVEFLETWLQHAQLSAQTLAAFHAQQTDKTQRPAFLAAKAALDEFRKNHPNVITNTGVLRQVEVWSGWRPSAELKE